MWRDQAVMVCQHKLGLVTAGPVTAGLGKAVKFSSGQLRRVEVMLG